MQIKMGYWHVIRKKHEEESIQTFETTWAPKSQKIGETGLRKRVYNISSIFCQTYCICSFVPILSWTSLSKEIGTIISISYKSTYISISNDSKFSLVLVTSNLVSKILSTHLSQIIHVCLAKHMWLDFFASMKRPNSSWTLFNMFFAVPVMPIKTVVIGLRVHSHVMAPSWWHHFNVVWIVAVVQYQSVIFRAM